MTAWFYAEWYRDILMCKTTKDINLLIFKDEFSTVKQVAALSGYEGLERILAAIDKARVRLDANDKYGACDGTDAPYHERELRVSVNTGGMMLTVIGVRFRTAGQNLLF